MICWAAFKKSLLSQSIKIDCIRVNIPKTYRRFPDHSFQLPNVPEGVDVVLGDRDYGPATKVLPTIREHRNNPAKIIFCDDDRECHPDWAKTLVQKSIEKPNCAIANSGWDISNLDVKYDRDFSLPRAKRLNNKLDVTYRMRRIHQKITETVKGVKLPKPYRNKTYYKEGYLDILEGCGGVLVKLNFFTSDVFNVPEKVWSVDDIWLSGMLAYNGTKIWSNSIGYMPNEMHGAGEDALCNDVIEGLDRTESNEEEL